MGDEGLIRQALVNLVDNAVKYSPDGSHVAIEYQQEPEGNIITVSDTGTPIPEQAQKRLFERFYRMDTVRSRKLAGTGLGLSIVRHIMMMHKGEVHLVSSPFWKPVYTGFFPCLSCLRKPLKNPSLDFLDRSFLHKIYSISFSEKITRIYR